LDIVHIDIYHAHILYDVVYYDVLVFTFRSIIVTNIFTYGSEEKISSTRIAQFIYNPLRSW